MDGNLVRTFKNEHSFSNMCRVCLAWNGDSMPSIFGSTKNEYSVPITEVINHLTNISIKEGDGLPERICDTCLTAIERIIEFKQLCEQTDTNLRNFLLSLNGKNGFKSSSGEAEIGDVQPDKSGASIYSGISERICVESEIVVVDPSCSVEDDNLNQSEVSYEPPSTNQRQEQEWSVDQSTGHSVFDWSAADNASEFVSSSYDAVESLTYDKLAATAGNYLSVRVNSSEDEVEIETFECKTCHKTFHTRKWLERHTQLHNETMPFPCDYCFRTFSKMQELVSHWRDHAGPGRDFCRQCGEAFADRKQQLQHRAMHAQRPPPPPSPHEQAHTCDTCLVGFPNLGDMQRHMLTNHPGNTVAQLPARDESASWSEHRCSVCHKSFGRRSNLMKHMLALHSGFRPHRCSTCGKTFASKSDLARHTSTHTGERPHTCTVCLYSFSRRDKLVRHMRTHSSERPYTCELCDTRFKWKDKLLRHMRVHQEQDPAHVQLQLYKCKQCPDSFKTRPELNRHIVEKHGVQSVILLNRLDNGSEQANAVKVES